MDLSPQRDCFFVWPLCYCRCRFLQRWLYERFDISLLHRCCRLDGFPTQNDRTSIHMIVVPPCTRTIALFSRLTSVPSFGFTVGEPGRFSFHVAPLARQSLTRFEGMKKPLFVSQERPFELPYRKHKERQARMRSLCNVSSC